jgi:hypothetical protein
MAGIKNRLMLLKFDGFDLELSEYPQAGMPLLIGYRQGPEHIYNSEY